MNLTCVDRLLEVYILVVVVVVVAVDPVVDIGHSVEYCEGHPSKHQRNQVDQLRTSCTVQKYTYIYNVFYIIICQIKEDKKCRLILQLARTNCTLDTVI